MGLTTQDETHCTLIQHTMHSAGEMAAYMDSCLNAMSYVATKYKSLLHCSHSVAACLPRHSHGKASLKSLGPNLNIVLDVCGICVVSVPIAEVIGEQVTWTGESSRHTTIAFEEADP